MLGSERFPVDAYGVEEILREVAGQSAERVVGKHAQHGPYERTGQREASVTLHAIVQSCGYLFSAHLHMVVMGQSAAVYCPTNSVVVGNGPAGLRGRGLGRRRRQGAKGKDRYFFMIRFIV